jgi:hypothetical protein
MSSSFSNSKFAIRNLTSHIPHEQPGREKTPTDLQLGDQWGPGRANLGGDLTSRKKRKQRGSPAEFKDYEKIVPSQISFYFPNNVDKL